MVTFTTESARKLLKETNPNEAFAHAIDRIDLLEFADWEESVKDDIKFLRDHPLIAKDSVITGWVYHIETGKVRPSACQSM
jgi:carbonic anhydrase